MHDIEIWRRLLAHCTVLAEVLTMPMTENILAKITAMTDTTTSNSIRVKACHEVHTTDGRVGFIHAILIK